MHATTYLAYSIAAALGLAYVVTSLLERVTSALPL